MPPSSLDSRTQTDAVFDAIFPLEIQAIAEIHFSPVKVCRIAADYLAQTTSTKILDIGAGAGKFCLVGAALTGNHFTGVEHRQSLHNIAESIVKKFKLKQIDFVHSNILDVNFKDFDAFYMYNSFYENVHPDAEMSDEVHVERALYETYSLYVKQQLDSMPIGTRLATYHSFLKEIPDSYLVRGSFFDEKLKLWEKVQKS